MHIHARAHRPRSVEYTSRTSEGSLLPAVCGSAVSHTPLFLRNQCMHTTAAGARARARKGIVRRRAVTIGTCMHAYTEMESAANALTYDGLLLREVGRRDTRLLRARARTRVIAASARVRLSGSKKATQTRLARASFFEFHASSTHRGICSMYALLCESIYLRPLSFLRLQISRSSHSNGFLYVCAKSSIFGKLLHSMINRDIHILI